MADTEGVSKRSRSGRLLELGLYSTKIIPPLGVLVGSLLPWVQFTEFQKSPAPTWHAPLSLLAFGSVGWGVIVIVAFGILIGVWDAAMLDSGAIPISVTRVRRVMASTCFGAGVGACVLVTSRFGYVLGSKSFVFGLGSLQGIDIGMVVFVLSSGAWVAASEWGWSRSQDESRQTTSGCS